MSKTILKLEKIKDKHDFGGRAFHNFGLVPKARPNADRDLTYLNHALINKDSRSYINLFEKRLKAEKIKQGKETKIRKNGVLAYEVVLGYGLDDGEFNLDKETFAKWEEENIKFLKDTFGEDNVISAVVHLDEEYPHIHAIVTPIDENGKLNAYSFTGKRAQFFNMQKDYADRMAQFGIEKGRTYSKADNKELKKFYSDAHSNFNLNVPEKMDGEEVDAYCERVRSWAVTEKNKALKREKALENKLNEVQAKHKQFYVENRQAILLAQLIRRKYLGERRSRAEGLISNILKMVNEVPISVLEKGVDFLINKYKDQNIIKVDESVIEDKRFIEDDVIYETINIADGTNEDNLFGEKD